MEDLDSNLQRLQPGDAQLMLTEQPSSSGAFARAGVGAGSVAGSKRKALQDKGQPQSEPGSEVPGLLKAVKKCKDPLATAVWARKVTIKEFNIVCEKLGKARAQSRATMELVKSDYPSEDGGQQ